MVQLVLGPLRCCQEGLRTRAPAQSSPPPVRLGETSVLPASIDVEGPVPKRRAAFLQAVLPKLRSD
jgi:hypothetical protein